MYELKELERYLRAHLLGPGLCLENKEFTGPRSHKVGEKMTYMNMAIAERLAKGNKAHYANAKPLESKFLNKNTKMKRYKTKTRPVVTY